MDIGVYIHFPWCRNRCPYCDFAVAVAPVDELPHRVYLEAVLEEFELRLPEAAGRRLVSIYFGGGTPSLWDPSCIAELVERVGGAFGDRAAELEVTLEANPIDCRAPRLAEWTAAGIGRLSIGVQSSSSQELVTLGRDHGKGEGMAALSAAMDGGFRSLSADVILGVPGGSGLGSTLSLAETGVPHVSIYELTIKEQTPMARMVARGELVPEDEDRLAELYIEAHGALEAAGYEHYEISSFARPGHRAVHNSLYWRGAEFLGLGNGAASFLRDPAGGGRRTTNHRSVGRYLAASAAERIAEQELLSREDLACDQIWLGMRTVDGVAEELFEIRPRLAERLVSEGLAERSAGRIRPTLRGFLYSDQVARRVLAK